jgi:hypothetical protein
VTTLQGILLGVGALLEFGGIVALAFPDFLPHGRRLSRWLGHRARLAINWVRRRLGMEPLQKVVSLSAAVEASSAMHASGIKGSPPDATVEEKVAWLIKRDQEAQREFNELARLVGDLEEGTAQQIERLRDDMRAHVSSELAAAEQEYRPLRIFGTIALAVGLACTTLANFL